MYMFIVESWSFTDALYFITVTLTTAGFGVLVPTNDGSRAFTTLFICSGMVLLAVVVTDVLRTWSEERERVVNQIRARAALGRGMGGRVAKSFSAPPQNSPLYRYWRDSPVSRNLLMLLVFTLLFAAIFVSVEDSINYGNCVYFTVVAATTVGYGDVHPNTSAAKWVIILLLPPAVYVVSSTLSDIASYILDEHKKQQSSGSGGVMLITDTQSDAEQEEDLSVEGLRTWSKANPLCPEGITEGDYLFFTLSRSKLVDEDILNRLRDKFKSMNSSGSGLINFDELQQLADATQRRAGGSFSSNSDLGLQEMYPPSPLSSDSDAVVGDAVDV
eukprot:CAMPEP_0114349104 /NCGR_PEP_ID=MMETSP0101-20121206/15272_1 /TAXON_ID=38822 ORGANISM="Pteridomonas danica, Strain PT" /NCGR_SAMPLE_ID=MMETSP0101 /ASSEMBLY_ACC=CAM_ASM_000211 /LENGTH=329 /DNA_ID=CAMNT_0001487491 /DNA_START=242 /DNA_END=1231 /DNA_ORIENTATION=-